MYKESSSINYYNYKLSIGDLNKHANMFDVLPGIPALRKAICDFHQRYDDITFRPEDVLVGPGSKELIFLAMNVFKGGKSSLIILNSEHNRDIL